MTNYERWRSYTDGLSSPENFLDWTWLYCVASSLQRRVWYGPIHQPIFPNMYTILVGPPGVGKGLSIGAAENLLRHWHLGDNKDLFPKRLTLTDAQKVAVDTQMSVDEQKANEVEYQGNQREAEIVKPLLIPVAADAITYEALVQVMGQSLRRIQYTEVKPDGKSHLQTYCHSSLCFLLKELASLMRKKTNDTVNYLLGLYDCPVDYEYRTKTQGMDRVKRGCINLLAGTTPAFMQSTFDESLADEGFNSRVFYIYAAKNRKNQFRIPLLTKEQEDNKLELLEHIRHLSTLYGSLTTDTETEEYLQNWWNTFENEKSKRTNKSIKLIPYYSRKNIHVVKVAIAYHFSESLSMHIPLSAFQWAIKHTEKEEKNMHLAIVMESDNPMAKVAKKIISCLESGEKNFVEIMCEMGAMKRVDLEEALTFLQETNQVLVGTKHDKDLDRNIAMYGVR